MIEAKQLKGMTETIKMPKAKAGLISECST